MEKVNCLVPNCNKRDTKIIRGLCGPHYNLTLRLVRQEKTSFDKLISEGKILPAGPQGSKKFIYAEAWFLGDTNVTQ